MRVAICTMVGYSNYGNKLQNYALQKVLENLGNEVVTIRNYTDIQKKESRIKRIIRLLKTGTLLKKIRIKLKGEDKSTQEMNRIREKKFRKFTSLYINESSFYINQNTSDFTFDNNIDCYVIGSDQVWNYSFPSFFPKLDFVEYSKKPKLSYAASFGVNNIPDEFRKVYKDGLEKLRYISVRENEGKKIVEEISDKEAQVVLDPTLLLDKEEWKKLIVNCKKFNEHYIVMYFLDPLTPENEKYITEYASKHNCIIKNLYSINDVEMWESDPAEFVNVISQSEGVFTDSFHASVFSIVFKKYFEVFARNNKGPSMQSRMNTLLGNLDIMDRIHDSNNNSKDTDIDYDLVHKKLNLKKAESLNFLTHAMKNIKKDTLD